MHGSRGVTGLCASLTAGVTLVAACSSSSPSSVFEPGVTTQDQDASTVEKPTVKDPSFIRGACLSTDRDGAPPLWECPEGESCMDLSAFDVRGDTCKGSLCPVCVKSAEGRLFLACPRGQTLSAAFNYPGSVWCAGGS
jgi:hypothetical protein